MGYRCISHLWGNATRWEDHPVGGATWKVEVREEKREKLLQIFKHYKGYWWMDVFCTNQEDINKPLDVMGDIYLYCKECVCLLDYRYIPSPKIREVLEKYAGDIVNESEEMALMDVLAKSRIYMHNAVEPKKPMYKLLGYKLRLEINSQMYFHERMRNFPLLEYVDSSSAVDEYMDLLSSCNWFKRVWTLQESILPKKVFYTPEHTTSKLYVYDLYTIGDAIDPVLAGYSFFERPHAKNSNIYIDGTLTKLKITTRFCKELPDYFYGISGLFGLEIKSGLDWKEARNELSQKIIENNVPIKGMENVNPEVIIEGRSVYRELRGTWDIYNRK
jgi:hypothetical protein